MSWPYSISLHVQRRFRPVFKQFSSKQNGHCEEHQKLFDAQIPLMFIAQILQCQLIRLGMLVQFGLSTASTSRTGVLCRYQQANETNCRLNMQKDDLK